jgi:hypothetical protein
VGSLLTLAIYLAIALSWTFMSERENIERLIATNLKIDEFAFGLTDDLCNKSVSYFTLLTYRR